MAETNTQTAEIEEELIPVETPPEEPADTAAETPAEEDDEDEDDEDARLADSEDDSDADITAGNSKAREKRAKRRELRKQAKERTESELRAMREMNAQLLQRLQAVEGNTLQQNQLVLDQRLTEAQNEMRQTELIIARAVEAGNGADVAEAIRLRDEAKAKLDAITASKQRVEQVRKQGPAPDPRVTSYAQQWLAANPWYDPQGRDEDSAITRAIDNRLAAEGYSPASAEYWQELTRRVAARLNTGATERADTQTGAPKKKAPPMGVKREHAPTSTRKEVFVTPERKQAMIEAGVWDDPVKRQRTLKAYQEYDRGSDR